jgi:hypothetical protein
MLASEQAPVPVIQQIGIRALAGYLTPTFMLLCGLLLWFCSVARTYHSLVAILLALDSWLTADLGGFVIGMLISVIGGALAFAWMTDADFGSSGWLPAKARIRLPSWVLKAVSRLKAGHAWQSEGGASIGLPSLADLQACTRKALRVRSAVAATLDVLRRLPAARLRRRRAPGRTQVPVQQALFELRTDPDSGEPTAGGPLAGRVDRNLLRYTETLAAAAARWSRLALARCRRQSDR